MWYLIGAIGVGLLIVGALRFVALLKMHMLDMQETFQDKFFAGAHQIVEWENISDKRLSVLAFLSSTIRSRKMQISMIQNFKKVKKKGGTTDLSYGDVLTKDQLSVWNQTLYFWIAAVFAQGTLVGIGCLLELIKTYDPEKTGSKAEDVLLSTGLAQPAH